MLPITPYPTVLLVFGPDFARSIRGRRAEGKPYTRGSEASKTFGPWLTVVAMPSLRAVQIANPR